MPRTTGYVLENLETLRKRVATEVELDKKEPRKDGYRRHDQGTWGTFWSTDDLTEFEKYTPSGGWQYAALTCPTSACAAGHASLAAGAKMLVSINADGTPSRGSVENVLTPEGTVEHISSFAAKWLGIDSSEKDRLFSGAPTSAQTLWNIDELICAAKHGRTWEEQRVLNGGRGLHDAYLDKGPMVGATID